MTATRRNAERWGPWGACAFVLFATVAAWALDFPKLTGRVVDQAGLLTASNRASLTDTLRRHEDRTTNQVVVVTLKSLQGVTIEEFGYQLGRHWGIGQKGKNNGALLIVAPNQRKVRIEVGYGLEGTLTDAVSKLIIENSIIPEFRAGRMEAGVLAGTKAIVGVLEGRELPPASRGYWNREFLPFVLMFLVFLTGGLFTLVDIFPGRTNVPGRRSRRRDYDDGRPWDGGFGGGSGGGGFSGGGGSFGGGGASGGW